MTARCRACDGTGQQVAADQTGRPCSRCDAGGFGRWSAAFAVVYGANAVVRADPSVTHAVRAAADAADGYSYSIAVAVADPYPAPAGVDDEARAAARDDFIAALNAA